MNRMNWWRRVIRIWVFLGVMLAGLGAPTVSMSDETATRLTLALRQATLLHSMNAAACFAMGGIDADRQRAIAVELVDSYSTALTAFRDGHDWLGLSGTRDPGDLAAIDDAAAAWHTYRPAVEQIVAGDLHAVVMRQVMRDASPTADRANRLATYFVETAFPTDLDAAQRAAAVLASQYRMLTQRALTEMCFVLFDLGSDTMRDRLGLTMGAIDASITQLTQGDTRTAPPPTDRVARNMRTAQVFWDKMRETIDAVRHDTPLDPADVRKLLKFNRAVLKQLDQAVAGYFG